MGRSAGANGASCIDAQTLPVRAICVTSNNVGDAAVMPELLAQVSAQEQLLTVTRDEAYDTQPVHAAVMQRNAAPIIPPRKNARLRKGDAACRRFGRKLWKNWSCYHRRSLVEAKMHRIKRLVERGCHARLRGRLTSCTSELPSSIDLLDWAARGRWLWHSHRLGGSLV